MLVLCPVEFAPAPPVSGLVETAETTRGVNSGGSTHVWSAPSSSASVDGERCGDVEAVLRLEQQLALSRSQVLCDVCDPQMSSQFHSKSMSGAHDARLGRMHGAGGTPGLVAYTTPGAATPATGMRRGTGTGGGDPAGTTGARNVPFVRAPLVSDSEEEEEEDDEEEEEEEDDDEDDDDEHDDDGADSDELDGRGE